MEHCKMTKNIHSPLFMNLMSHKLFQSWHEETKKLMLGNNALQWSRKEEQNQINVEMEKDNFTENNLLLENKPFLWFD